MDVCISCIVEGHGEVASLPKLLYRLQADLAPAVRLHVPPVQRQHLGNLLRRQEELGRAVKLAAMDVRRRGSSGGVLILFDSDKDCPAERALPVRQAARRFVTDIPVEVVVAKCEYEAWFLAAAESLRGCLGLPEDFGPPALGAEEVLGAKGWLERHLGRKYHSHARPNSDQLALTMKFDLTLARQRSPSFVKLCHKVAHLLRAGVI
jgi:hypothetical protein